MQARRIVAVSSDVHLADRLSSTLELSGSIVEVTRTLAGATRASDAAVFVVYADDTVRAELERFTAEQHADSRFIVLLERPDLAATVALMQVNERVVGALVVDDGLDQPLREMIQGVLSQDCFGIGRHIAASAPQQTHVITNYSEKDDCIDQLRTYALQVGGSQHLVRSLEQCCDELLMNALYDAPVDAAGAHVFAGVPTRERIRLSVDQEVAVRFGCDGRTFALSVRDGYGSLTRATVLRFLHKGLHAVDKIDRKAGGAGLGLFLMANECSALYINIIQGLATEVVCMFALDGKHTGLSRFGILEAASDVTGQLVPAARASTPRALRGRRWPWLAGGAVLACAAAGGLALGMRRRTAPPPVVEVQLRVSPGHARVHLDGRPIENLARPLTLEVGRPYLVLASLAPGTHRRQVLIPQAGETTYTINLEPSPALIIESTPTDATVTLDGRPLGSTPLQITHLSGAPQATITLHREGSDELSTTIRVPSAGTHTERFSLVPSTNQVPVLVESTPPGARVRIDGRDGDTTYTPATVFVPLGTSSRLVLSMPEHAPTILTVAPTDRSQDLRLTATLPPAASLRVEGERGTVTVVDTYHCRALPIPAECPLAPGTYTIEHADAGAPRREVITIGEQDVTISN